MSNKQETKIRHPRDAAKNIIRKNIVTPKVIHLHLTRKDFKKKTEDYSGYVDIKGKKIVITEFFGVSVRIEFDVYLVMQDILKEVANSLTPHSIVFVRKRPAYFDSAF